MGWLAVWPPHYIWACFQILTAVCWDRGWGKLKPFCVPVAITLLMWLLGPISSACINPARAFGVAFVTGYPSRCCVLHVAACTPVGGIRPCGFECKPVGRCQLLGPAASVLSCVFLRSFVLARGGRTCELFAARHYGMWSAQRPQRDTRHAQNHQALHRQIYISLTYEQEASQPHALPCCRAWNQHWVYWIADILGGAAAAILYSKILLPKDA